MFGRNLSAVIDRSAQADSGRSLAHTHSTVIHMFRIFALLVVAFGLAFGAAAPAMAQSVRVTVNGEGITDTQIEQRLKLFQLEGRSGRDAATNELIDEALMLQEAKRLGITVSENQVSDALLSVARNIRLSPERLREVLAAAGVNIDTLRNRLRAAIAWQQVAGQVISQRVQISELELDQKASTMVQETTSYDYVLKEVLFLTTGGRSASSRTNEANRYRRSFAGCDSAVQLSLSYTDAAVVDLGRRHATQLPSAIATELAGLNVGGITKPRVVDNGVSMLAVCSKASARDLTFIKDQIRSEQGNAALEREAANYLAELRNKANITRR
jgi:peptidyl-prolyl cis-trans isomerase SurA